MPHKKRSTINERIRLYFKKVSFEREERAKRRYKKKVIRRRIKEHQQEEKQKPQRVRSRSRKRIRNFFPPLPGIPLFEKQNRTFLYLAVDSTAIYIITFILVYFLYQLIILAGASLWGTGTIQQYHRMVFTGHASLYSRLGILFIASVGPNLTLVLGLILFTWVFRLKFFSGLQRLFVLWLALHSINHFFGALMYGAITNEGFKDVTRLLNIQQVLMFFLAFIALILLFWIGLRATRPFLETTTSLTMINSDNRRRFIINQVILPWIVGSLLLAMLFDPDNLNFTYELLTFITMGFIIIPVWFNRHRRPRFKIRKIKIRIHYTYVVLVVILLIALWVASNKGLGFTTVFDLIK